LERELLELRHSSQGEKTQSASQEVYEKCQVEMGKELTEDETL